MKTNIENIVCLISSSLMFCISLSFIIALYSRVPLTPSAIMHGIAIMLCNSILANIKITPFFIPNTETKDEIVKPKQKPLKHIIMYTIIKPITVELRIHNKIPIERLLNKEFFKIILSVIFPWVFKELIKEVM